MTLETLRNDFSNIRKTIPFTYRSGWDVYQARLKDLDTPPTPTEWIKIISQYAEESRLSSAKGRWESLRSSNPVGWGEDLSLSQIVGWSEDLPIPYRIALIEKQIREDLKLQLAYEDWEDRGR